MQAKPKGFTLLEVLIVLALISLIALIAYPNYIHYIHKTNRIDAINSLFHYQALWQQCTLQKNAPEQCLQDHNLTQPTPSLQNHYTINAKTTNHTTTFQATPTHTQKQDTQCQKFTLDNYGNQTAFNNENQETTQECW